MKRRKKIAAIHRTIKPSTSPAKPLCVSPRCRRALSILRTPRISRRRVMDAFRTFCFEEDIPLNVSERLLIEIFIDFLYDNSHKYFKVKP